MAHTAKKWLGRTVTRQVTVPTWLGVFLIITPAYALIKLVIQNPQLIIVVAVANILFYSLIVRPLRRKTGQDLDANFELEAEEAPDTRTKWAVIWRRLRTWDLWALVLAGALDAGIILEAAGLVTLPF